MSQFDIRETSKSKEPGEGMELQLDEAPKSYRVNPREILIQVLHRPQEMIHPGLIDSSYTWVDQGCGFQRISDPFGGWVHISRNWQTRQFMARKEFKYLLLLDADESVPWWVPFQLAELDLPVVSGVVCGFTAERGIFACVAVKGEDGKARFPSVTETKTIPARGVQEVHNAGTGCLMIRRDVMEKLWARFDADPSFGQPFSIPEAEQNTAAIQGALPRGEDICFTDRCRALDIPISVDWGCKLGHQKPFNLAWPANMVTEMDANRWAKLAWPRKGPGARGAK
jgi:hypothetical protein